MPSTQAVDETPPVVALVPLSFELKPQPPAAARPPRNQAPMRQNAGSVTSNVRAAEATSDRWEALRGGGTCPLNAGNASHYGTSAVELLETFERICAENSHEIFLSGDEPAGQVPVHELVKREGLKPPSHEVVTLFQSSVLPALTLVELATMLRRNTRCDKSTLGSAVLLQARFCEMTNLKPTLHMMHRMFVACLQIATKSHSDVFLRNDRAARLSGLRPSEINRLEVHIITGCDWHLVIDNRDLVDVTTTCNRMRMCLALSQARNRLRMYMPSPAGAYAAVAPESSPSISSSYQTGVLRGSSQIGSEFGPPSVASASIHAGDTWLPEESDD